jgi:PAS domain S-box-containing protein
VVYFKDGKIRGSYGPADGLGAGRVNALQLDSQNTLWAATDGGLSRIKDGRVATLTGKNGLPCDKVHEVVEDDDHSLWLYLACGMVRVARPELDAWVADPHHKVKGTVFDTSDGVANHAGVTPPAPRAAKTADGRLWFLSLSGVSVVDPAHLRSNKLPPPVHIEQITADRKTYWQNLSGNASSAPPRLPPRVRDLEIDYTALSFVAPDKVRFRYKLEGRDSDWQDVGTRRQAFYSDLAPRKYRFRVMACNNSGVWNESGDELEFSIAPAYYQTYWFLTLCAAILVALVWAVYQLRIRQLQRDFRKLRDVIETIPAMAWTALPDGSNEFVNRRWAEYTGLSAEETAGSGWTAAVHPEDLQAYREKWRASMATGEPFEFEARFRCAANGEYRWLLARGVPLRDEHGRVIRWYGILTDIEDRRRAEDALVQSEAYLAEGQRLTHTGSFAWNPATGETIYFSEEMSRIFGLSPQEGVLSSETLWQRVHPEDRDHTRELLMKATLGNMEFEHEPRIVLPDGTVKHIHGIGHPVLGKNGQVAKYVGTAVDVTERKRAEQERERLRQLEAELAHINRVSMLGELAASIAHEVNQPLAGVVSNGSACLRWLVRDVPNIEEAREAVHRIVRDGKRAGEVIARIRALTRRDEMSREKLDLNATIQEVLTLVGDEAKRKSVIIRTQFADDLSPVSGDRVQLQQVVLNLVINAIEAMSGVVERTRELVITTVNIDPDQVQATVEDSGTGLEPNAIDKIFDSFYTTKPAGMGMGLSISRSILQSHGGRLWATAKDGKGSIFYFKLPKNHEDESNSGVAEA